MTRSTGIALVLSAALLTATGCKSSTEAAPLVPGGQWVLVSVDGQSLPAWVSTSTDPNTFMNTTWYLKGCTAPDSLRMFAVSASLDLKADSTVSWQRTYIDHCMQNGTVMAADTVTYDDTRMLWSRPATDSVRINLADWYAVGHLTSDALDLVLYQSPNHYRYERP